MGSCDIILTAFSDTIVLVYPNTACTSMKTGMLVPWDRYLLEMLLTEDVPL